jgi:hypothetical protein
VTFRRGFDRKRQSHENDPVGELLCVQSPRDGRLTNGSTTDELNVRATIPISGW